MKLIPSTSSSLLLVLLCIWAWYLECTQCTNEPNLKKIWQKNTNFGDPNNWDGNGENCSKNIFSFPSDMDLEVISFPSNTTISTREIILPRNGHLVFQTGLTTLFHSPSDTCQGIELRFRRTGRADWFDPNNWNGTASLLNAKAIPHVERVPCQYDYVQFPSQSSFHLFISADVFVHKFFLGDEELSNTDLALLMNTPLGRIQFEKSTQTVFELKTNPRLDSSICHNYNKTISQKICTFVKCTTKFQCSYPIVPEGFCCPVCGYRINVEHVEEFPLTPVKEKLVSKIKKLGLEEVVGTYIGRYEPKFAHIVFIPEMNKVEIVRKLIDEVRSFLDTDALVLKTTVSTSWDSSGHEADNLNASGTSGGIIALIVVLVLITIIGIAIYIYFKKWGTYPTISFNDILSRLPSIPNLNIPGSPRPSFAFARFSNERISNINIGQTAAGELHRAERVDSDAEAIGVPVPDNSGGGFSNPIYDIVDPEISAPRNDGLADGTDKNGSMRTMENDGIYELVDVSQDSPIMVDITKPSLISSIEE